MAPRLILDRRALPAEGRQETAQERVFVRQVALPRAHEIKFLPQLCFLLVLSSGGAAVSQRAADSASITGRLASFLHPISALTKSLTDSTSSGHAGAGGAAATTTAAASEREALLARRSPVPSHPHHRPDPLVATHSGNAAAAGSPRHLQQLWSMLAHYSAWRGDVVALNVALMYLQEHGLELAAEAQPGVARAVFNANNPAVLREVSRLCTQCVEC